MMIFFGPKVDVVLFVKDLLQTFEFAFQSITIIRRGVSGDFCVLIATGMLSEDIVEKLAQAYSLQRINT